MRVDPGGDILSWLGLQRLKMADIESKCESCLFLELNTQTGMRDKSQHVPVNVVQAARGEEPRIILETILIKMTESQKNLKFLAAWQSFWGAKLKLFLGENGEAAEKEEKTLMHGSKYCG